MAVSLRRAIRRSPRRRGDQRPRARSLRVGTTYLLAILFAAALVGAYFIGRTNAPSSPVGPAPNIPITFSAFYLDIGASASLGFQPTGIRGHNGHSTNDGYADDLALMERLRGTSLSVDKTGCPGETLQSFLATAVMKHCNNLVKTQLSKDVAYLQAHQGESGLITIDIGFNNIRDCLTYAKVNEACVDKAVSAAKVDTPKIVKNLKDASGANVQIVGLEYNDPFLGHYLNGPTGPADADATLVAMNRMNTALKSAYSSAGASVADVPALFQMDNTSPVTITNVGTMPENVKEACDLTWLCYSSPFGPDDHPNDAGYTLIAKAIFAVLPKTW